MMTLDYNFGNRDTVCSQKWRNMEGKIITFKMEGLTDFIRNIRNKWYREKFFIIDFFFWVVNCLSITKSSI